MTVRPMHRRSRARALAAMGLAGLATLATSAGAGAAGLVWSTERVNLPDPSTGNVQANHHTDDVFEGTMTPDGRYVVFTSKASNMVTADTDTASDLFVRDRQLGTTELINVSSSGVKGFNDTPFALDITPDGRFVVFASNASNLVSNDVNGHYDVFVRDRQFGKTELVSVAIPSWPIVVGANGASGFNFGGASITDDGRYVAFESAADNLVPGDTNGETDIFVRDRKAGTTDLISVSSTGVQADGSNIRPRISGHGRYIVFSSEAGSLDPLDDTPGQADVYLHNRKTGTTELVSLALDGTAGNQSSGHGWPTDDGRFVVFQSDATDLDLDDDNLETDIYVRDRTTGSTELLVTEADGTAPDLGAYLPIVTPDFRLLMFATASHDLVSGDTNGVGDVFVLEISSGTIDRVSVAQNGTEPNHWSNPVGLSNDGRHLAYMSYATNLVRGDTNGADDVFVRERQPSRP